MRELKTKIALRRDSEENWNKIAESFVPMLGEVCFIDTASKGLRAKVGNGESFLKNLPYTDEIIYKDIDSVVLRCYYLNSKMYTDSTYTVEAEKSLHKVYIDNNTRVLYNYDGTKYVSVNDTLPNASENISGIMKLYGGKGSGTDGTMTQKSITDNLNTKFEVSVDADSETAIFSITL